jgi:transposase
VVKQEYIDQLIGLQGFGVRDMQFLSVLYREGEEEIARSEEEKTELVVTLKRTDGKYVCPCGREHSSYYDARRRRVRDLRYGMYKWTWIVFEQCRVDCREGCGRIRTERLAWVDPQVSYTKRLAAAVALSCRQTRSLKSIGQEYGLHWQTVKEIDKRALEEELPEVGETEARLLAVDEFSIRKRHRYGTTVLDVEKKEVLYVGKDRTEESLAAFYRQMGEQRCMNVEAVAMDMWKPYLKATKRHCPNAVAVFDPFHIIQSYGRDVVDRVRIDEYRKATAEQRQVIKGSRYLLLKNKQNLNSQREEPSDLQQLLALNRRLEKVYILKDDLKQLWRYKSPAWALKWFAGWYRRAIYSRIEPLKKFARMLKSHIDGILAHCKYPIHTGILEGINNKIKVIKRVAYGYRDEEYFFLKIRGAFAATHKDP